MKDPSVFLVVVELASQLPQSSLELLHLGSNALYLLEQIADSVRVARGDRETELDGIPPDPSGTKRFLSHALMPDPTWAAGRGSRCMLDVGFWTLGIGYQISDIGN